MTLDEIKVTTEGAEADGTDEVPAWLRTLVVVLGVAIIIMIMLIVGTIIKRAMAVEEAEAPAAAAFLPADAPTSGDVLLDIQVERPAGSQLVYSQIAGRELLLHFKLENGSDMIMTVDRFSGTVRRLTVLPDPGL